MTRHNAQKSAEASRLGRDDWLKAALALLAETGQPDGIKIDILCQRLGVTKGSFYWHFKGRAALIEALIDYWAGRFHEQIQAELGTVPASQPMEFLIALSEYWRQGSFASTDAAMRRWAAMDGRVAEAIESADRYIMDLLVEMFVGFGKAPEVAERNAFLLMALGVAAPQIQHLQKGASEAEREDELRTLRQLILSL